MPQNTLSKWMKSSDTLKQHYTEFDRYSNSDRKTPQKSDALETDESEKDTEEESESLPDGNIICDILHNSEQTNSRKMQKKTGVKRKLSVVTIEKKYQALLEVEKGVKKKAQIAADIGIPHNTLSTWIKNSEKIKQHCQDGCINDRKRIRNGEAPDTEKATLKWLKSINDQNIPVSNLMILTKAKEFANRLGENIKAPNNWLYRFKNQNRIKKIHNEGFSIDTDSNDRNS